MAFFFAIFLRVPTTQTMNKRNSKFEVFQKNLKVIQDSLEASNFSKALKHLLIAESIEPQNFAVINEIGTCYAKVGNNLKALEYHCKAASISSDNPIIIANIGLDLSKLQRFEECIPYFQKSIELDTKNSIAYIGLINVFHHLGDHLKVSQISIDAISKFPQMPEFHSSLGAALIGLNQLNEAEYCIDTALLLNPKKIDTKLNLGRLKSLRHKHNEAINIFEEVLQESQATHKEHVPVIKYNLSYEYFWTGDLARGWDNYDFGFDTHVSHYQSRKPNRSFDVKRWEGEPLENKTLLVWREQGLGDEIMFLSMLHDVSLVVKNIVVECDHRLVNIVKGSFPKVKVRASSFDSQFKTEHSDYDFHIPMGSLGKIFRRAISDFKNNSSYLIPQKINDPVLDEFFSDKKGQVKIGICWRSGILSNERDINYIPLHHWQEIFRIPNAVFVNLQYGDCELELLDVEKFFNVTIHRWPSIDLKRDLDTVFSLIHELDVVVTAGTAVSPMTYSIGKPALTFIPFFDWASFGTNYFPWSPNMIPFLPNEGEEIKSTLSSIAIFIKENF